MATRTCRNLDDTAKQGLRERAAKNGRSMEEGMRFILAGLDAVADTAASSPVAASKAASVPLTPSAAERQTLSGKRILLIISGGIAAYKSLDLIRRLRERGAEVRPLMTAAAQEFVTPLAVGAPAPIMSTPLCFRARTSRMSAISVWRPLAP